MRLKTRDDLQRYLEKVATEITKNSPYTAYVSLSAFLPELKISRKGLNDIEPSLFGAANNEKE